MRLLFCRLCPALLCLLIMGCQVSEPLLSPSLELSRNLEASKKLEPASALTTLYDYQLSDTNKQPLTPAQAAAQLADFDVIMVGELHGHQGIHRFQADLFAHLLQQHRPWVLAMEQFSRDHQAELDRYLAGELGEDAFIKQAQAWPSYKSDYRALLTLAKNNRAKNVPATVIAANAPRSIVRCIGKFGPEYLKTLPASDRGWVAEQLTLSDDDYKARFMANRHHGQAPSEQQFAAQTSWDDTMAESIADYLAQQPSHGVMLTVGRFHIAEGLGTVARLQQRNPKLKIALIYPVTADEAAPEALSARSDAPPIMWTVKVAALPPTRLEGEPLPAFSLGEPDCPFMNK
ncbi:ChaN family lipoprotein [Oceanisphaera sp. IT1-181]|uniref:ChaN family lipoprotein n=1 Tax=Oceanisphaera sp. IT1-181 TaxID=3081199 RepID=UPI0029C9F88D|nr:ChaN family lipoprotein [Oceanisphaera sp. IT1-181]